MLSCIDSITFALTIFIERNYYKILTNVTKYIIVLRE